jgi:transcriptional regulator with XRE-family HTH domain
MLTNLRAARLAAGLTTEAAGQLIGKSQSVYSKIERGRVRLGAIDAAKLATALRLDLAALLVTT